jgi:hypothetical protein
VATILNNYIHALGSNPLRFAAFGDRAYPAGFDFKIEAKHDLYEIGGQWLRADEFGNYAAGYAAQHAFGRAGHGAMILGGKYFARLGGSGEAPDDSESRPMIDGGARRAALEQANDGTFQQFNNGGYQRRYIEPLTSQRGCK